METQATPALTGYSDEDFSSRTTQSRLILKKDKNNNKYLTKYLRAIE